MQIHCFWEPVPLNRHRFGNGICNPSSAELIEEFECMTNNWGHAATYMFYLKKIYEQLEQVLQDPMTPAPPNGFIRGKIYYGLFEVCIVSDYAPGRDATIEDMENIDVIRELLNVFVWLAVHAGLLYIDIRLPNIRIDYGKTGSAPMVKLFDYDDCVLLRSNKPCCGRKVYELMQSNDHCHECLACFSKFDGFLREIEPCSNCAAPAFLSSRTAGNNHSSSGNSNESAQHLRNALNALLYQTGAPSRNFMLVLATNRPQDLDAAVLDRIDVSLQISLPGTEQRQALIGLYLDQHVLSIVNESKQHKSRWMLFARKIKEYCVDPDCLSSDAMQCMSDMTRGFSGREISKLFISAQYELYLSMDRKLTWMALQRVVQIKADEHRMKQHKFKLPPPRPHTSTQHSNNNAEDELHFAQIYGTGPEQGGEDDQFIATSPLSTSPTNFIAPAFEKPTVSRGRSLGRRSSVSNANAGGGGGGVVSASGGSGVTARTRGGMR